MTFRIRIRIKEDETVRRVVEAMREHYRAKADRVGMVAVQQAKRRIRDRGDEEIRWPRMWADDDTAVSESIGKFDRKDDGAEARRSSVVKAEKSLERARSGVRSGKTDRSKARGSIRRARNRLELARTGEVNPSYRRGGEPLRDEGALFASLTHAVRQTPKGAKVIVGSPLDYPVWQQNGFETAGPNYVPLTVKGKAKAKGVNPDDVGLVAGYDYIVFYGGVTVPARPISRFTPANRAELQAILKITPGKG